MLCLQIIPLLSRPKK